MIEDVIQQWGTGEIADYMVGSGTTEDVAKKMEIASYCYDLNRGFNLLTDEIRERPSLIFFHPPYWSMIKYAGSQYSAELVKKAYGFDPREYDLSRPQSWEAFLKELDYCVLKQYASLDKGGYMCVLVGDIKRKGVLYSMALEMAKPGTMEQVVIKFQHNCVSDRRSYTNNNFVPIMHEYLLVMRKDNSLIIPVQYVRKADFDIRDMKTPSWKDIVAAIMSSMGKKHYSLPELYSALDGHKRTKENSHWKEKIRQTLLAGQGSVFQKIDRGVWKLAA